MSKSSFSKNNLKRAHGHSIFHRDELVRSEASGCFHCLAIFAPTDVNEWTDTSKEKQKWTAMCPHCGIDAVLGDASGYPIEVDFLRAMQKRWF